MWEITRGPHPIGPRRWEWAIILSSHGAAVGHAWTHRGARRKLWNAQARLLIGD